MARITFCHYGRYRKDNFYRIYNLSFYTSKKNEVILFTTNPDYSVFWKTLRLNDNFIIVLFPSYIFPNLIGKTGFGLMNTLMRSIYILFSKPQIVYSDSNQRFTSGIPCLVSKLVYRSKYYAEWWDYYGKGGLFDYKKGLKKIIGYYEHYSEIPMKKSADLIVVLSSYMSERALKLGIEKDRILMIPGGADVDNIPFYNKSQFRMKYGFKDDSFVFGFVGINSQELNDIMPFIEALEILKQKVNFNIEWFTTGDSIENCLADKTMLGKEYHNFNYLSYNSFAELLSCADCFVSLLEDTAQNRVRWPNKIGDYFAAGRPILASFVGELRTISQKNLPGLIFVPQRVDSITNEIEQLLKRSDLEFLGKMNRDYAENIISWESRAMELPFNK